MSPNASSGLQDVHDFWNDASCGEELYLSGSDKSGYTAQMHKRYELEPFLPAFARPEAFTMVEGENLGNSQAVAWSLFTRHLLPFEIASIFLLIAMIGAVVLGRRQ